jgi:hypothetical protein
MQPAPHEPAIRTNTVRIGYARVSGRTQDHQMQLDALAAADCREVIVETASTRSRFPLSFPPMFSSGWRRTCRA